MPNVWGVTPLKNGDFLVVDRSGVREVNRQAETTWAFVREDAADYKLPNLQLAWRLPNGNTLINNWVNEWSGPVDSIPCASAGPGSDTRQEGRVGVVLVVGPS